MKKIEYDRITRWKKKPVYDKIILGCIFSGVSIFTILFLSFKDSTIATLTFIFTLMFVYGNRSIFKSRGIGKRTYYTKVGRKK